MEHTLSVTARGIIVHGTDILLIERFRDGMHYFSIPGGHVEANETTEQTVVREVLEETTISSVVEYPIFELRDATARHVIYLCKYIDGVPTLPPDAEETIRTLQKNIYVPKWVAIRELETMPFGYWTPLKGLLIKGLRSGFKSSIQVVTIHKSS
jgi:8-oxo-dGTP diphosphatase